MPPLFEKCNKMFYFSSLSARIYPLMNTLPDTKLPTIAQLQNVSGLDKGGLRGAAHAAGLLDDGDGLAWFRYWTGEAFGDSRDAMNVHLTVGYVISSNVMGVDLVGVCLP
jgi:hypothetical protein